MLATSARAWRAVVTDSAVVDRVREVARDVILRIEPQAGQRLILEAATARPNVRPSLHSLAQGYAGFALACGHLHRCFPDDGWDTRAHAHLTHAAQSAAATGVRSLGLFSGLSGLTFVTAGLAHGDRYRGFLTSLEAELYRGLADDPAGTTTQGLPVGEYDLVSGWSGIGAYLLSRPADPARDQALSALVDRVVEVVSGGRGEPAWFTPAHLISDPDMARRYPGGVINLGLAHGVPGPLSLLSLVATSEAPRPGLVDTVRTMTDWLIDQLVEGPAGTSVPSVVALAHDQPPSPSRTAWCYGSPGVASALSLAAVALGDEKPLGVALDLLESVLRTPVPERRIDSPGFCHGVAGLLQVTLRVGHRAGRETILSGVEDLVSQVMEQYEPASPLGFRTIEPSGARDDVPGLLEGSTGIALALLAAVNDEPPDWDRMFLLS